MTYTKDDIAKMNATLQKQMEECGNDSSKWMEKYNRHTLKVSLLNEQCNKELWAGEEITFFNEDNAISHLSVVGEFLTLLANNTGWGYKHTSEETIDAILNPIRDRLMGEMNTYRDEEEEGAN
jgi:hypothetical protein